VETKCRLSQFRFKLQHDTLFASRLQHSGYYTARDAVFAGEQLPAFRKYLVPPY
jgi:hypothetical protein